MEVHIRLKGNFYSFNTHCKTLKEAIQVYRLKRSWVAEWWKE